MSDQEIINLFSDLHPGENKIHVCKPRRKTSISVLTNSADNELLLEQGGLVTNVHPSVTKRYGFEVGDTVWPAQHGSPELSHKRGEEAIYVFDAAYISTYKKAEVKYPEATA